MLDAIKPTPQVSDCGLMRIIGCIAASQVIDGIFDKLLEFFVIIRLSAIRPDVLDRYAAGPPCDLDNNLPAIQRPGLRARYSFNKGWIAFDGVVQNWRSYRIGFVKLLFVHFATTYPPKAQETGKLTTSGQEI